MSWIESFLFIIAVLVAFLVLIILMGIAFDVYDHFFGEDGDDPQDLD